MRDRLEYTQRYEPDDIALIRIKGHFHPPGLAPLTVDDLHLVDDFRELKGPMDFIVNGCPHELVMSSNDWRIFRPLTYGTVLGDMRSATRLPLDYPIGAPGHDPLPHPGGLSGGLIWEHLYANPDRGELWKPGKALALQSAWNPRKKVLRATRLTKLREWLNV